MGKREQEDELLQKKREIQRQKMKKKRRRQEGIIRAGVCIATLALVVGVTVLATNIVVGEEKPGKKTETEKSSAAVVETEPVSENAGILEEADRLAAGYDYDAAIAKIKSVSGYEQKTELTQAIIQYTEAQKKCVPVDVDTVPHIFYHSLMNEPTIALDASIVGQGAADGMNAWMTTVEEFDKITQQMYDNGYVFVRLHDLVVETTDENGNKVFTKNENLLLPPGKKAVVLSVDDLSYYHSYEAASYPDKLVLDENGDVKCHYVKPDGSEAVGDFDVVPRLNTFLEAHPDGAYRGARGMIALTGYDGVLGYRTDKAYKTRENLTEDQSAWLTAHPDFDWDKDVEEAKKIAEAIKESGWEFASHTWGHLSVTNKTVDELKADNEKWVDTVQNIVGETDVIIFAHGNDIGDWHDYSADNEKFNYFKNAGYDFFCNVDGSVPYWIQIRENYVRQGRINLDGYMLYKAKQGMTDVTSGMFDAGGVYDSRRPDTVTANGES
ncbi:polysaccharide deacetylase family protein [Lachnospiraceae bacterium 46-15]